MAAYTVGDAKHATLTAGTVDTVTLGRNYTAVEVVNRGSDAIYFNANAEPDPTVEGDNTYVVPAGGALMARMWSGTTTVVKLISASATAYSVQGVS